MIGYGFMGRAHSNAYKRLNDFFPVNHRVVLQVACARNAEKVKAFADNWGYSRVETDGKKVVEAPDVDVVDICTPNDTHQEIAIAAAKAGKMILCEKPLARTVAEAEPMVEAVEKAGVPNMVWFNYRCVPAITLAKQLIEEGRIGRPFHMRSNFLQDWTISADLPQGGAGLWRLDVAAAGSGVTGDLLAHNIDTAMWLNGPITRVTAKTETFIKERPHVLTGKVEKVGIDDACLFICEFANGVYLDFFEYKQASGGTAESHVRGWRRIHVTNGEHPYIDRYWVPGLVVGYEHTFINALADFVRGIETGKHAPPNFRDALQTQKVCEAVLESGRTGQWVATGVE